MTTEQFKLVEEAFFRLQQMPASERAAALEEACGGDPLVREEVENLLRAEKSKANSISKFAHHLDDLLQSTNPGDAAATQSLVGQRVTHYEIIRLLGQGGMGVVYLGKDVRLGRMAALKSIIPASVNTPQQLERLRREARSLAAVKHPNVATLYGIEEAHGTLFLAMEYVSGKTLAEMLVGRQRLSFERTLSICEQIAAGVEAAHDAKVVHRDLKPGNVIITGEGVVKVLDFGLAQLVPTTTSPNYNSIDRSIPPQAHNPLTRSGSFFGTPAYMSPEQARGETLDNRSDIFSFGSILFRCLTGKSAFTGETDAELAESIVRHDPPWEALPENTPTLVRHVLRRCLCKRPAERYRHIGDVRLELRDALLAREWEKRERTVSARRPVSVWLPWLLTLALLVTIGALLISGRSPTVSPRSDLGVPASAQRFEVLFPRESKQTDPEHLQLALSPDGRTLVVACATEPDGKNLWMRTQPDGQWKRMPGTSNALRPFFSPDGQYIGFFRDGAIWQRPLNGGSEATRLDGSSNWYGAAWLGNMSAVVQVANWGQPIVQVAKTGEQPKPISRVNIDAGESSHMNPFIVPGDRWVVYNVWTGAETCDVHAVDLKTGQSHAVVSNASTPRVVATPRGTFLLFERASTVFAMAFDPATATVSGSTSAIVDGVMNDNTRFVAYYDVARDGTLTYMPGTAFAEENRVAYVNDDKTGTTPVLDDRLSFVEPCFSADGNRLFVVIKGKLYRGYVYDLKRGTMEAIVAGGDLTNGSISPDGNTLACTINKDGQYGVYLVSLIDGSHRRVFKCEFDLASDLSWTPDGKRLAFTMSPKEGVERDVWTVEAEENATPQPVVATPAAEERAHLSSDGKWLAYTSDSTGRREIYVMSFPDGNSRRQITLGGGDHPIYSPDGKSLYYRSLSGTLMRFTLGDNGMPTDKASVHYARPFGQSDPLARDFTVAPDGRVVVIEPSERRAPTTHIRAITRWFELVPDQRFEAKP